MRTGKNRTHFSGGPIIRKLWLIVLLVLIQHNLCLAQTPRNHIRMKDSLRVISFWRKIVKALEKGDTTAIQLRSEKVVECRCGTDSATMDLERWPSGKFAAQFIKKYKNTRKLQDAIKNEPPSVGISYFNKGNPATRFQVSYVPDKTPEDKGFGGYSIFFEFVLKNGSLKIHSIWTIP